MQGRRRCRSTREDLRTFSGVLWRRPGLPSSRLRRLVRAFARSFSPVAQVHESEANGTNHRARDRKPCRGGKVLKCRNHCGSFVWDDGHGDASSANSFHGLSQSVCRIAHNTNVSQRTFAPMSVLASCLLCPPQPAVTRIQAQELVPLCQHGHTWGVSQRTVARHDEAHDECTFHRPEHRTGTTKGNIMNDKTIPQNPNPTTEDVEGNAVKPRFAPAEDVEGNAIRPRI